MARTTIRAGEKRDTTINIADDAALLLHRDARLRVTSGTDAIVAGRHARINNNGEISSAGAIIVASGSTTIINREWGHIWGGSEATGGIGVFFGPLTLVNRGRIEVSSIYVDGAIDLRNKGTIGDAVTPGRASGDIRASGGLIINAEGAMIGGNHHAVLMDDGWRGAADAATRIVNNGLMTSQGKTIELIGSHDDTITNNGELRGGRDFEAIDTGGGNDRVVNTGTLTGNVRLGDGDDVFISTGSAFVIVDGGAGDDRITGDDSDFQLFIGGLGRDVMTGNGGADVFAYRTILESLPDLALADRITDFDKAEGDLIDLFAIDADITRIGDQAFSFIGSAAFSGTAGELRIEQRARYTAVLADVDGDALADFAIRLDGQYQPADMNFRL